MKGLLTKFNDSLHYAITNLYSPEDFIQRAHFSSAKSKNGLVSEPQHEVHILQSENNLKVYRWTRKFFPGMEVVLNYVHPGSSTLRLCNA